jgi:arginase family enzyme
MQIIKIPRFKDERERRRTPDLILKDLKKNYEEFSRLSLEEIHLDNSKEKEADKLIFENSKEEFEKQDRIFFIGGDESIEAQISKAFIESFKEKAFVFICAKPNIRLLQNLLEHVDKSKIYLIGLRNLNLKEKDFLQKTNIKIFSDGFNLEAGMDFIMEKIRKEDSLIFLNLNVLDPAFAPNVLNSEPGGMSTRELFYILRRIGFLQNMRGFCLYGVDGEKDEKQGGKTISVASRSLNILLGNYSKK